MILIVGHMRVPAENVGRFRDAAAALIASTRQEQGCLAYAFAEDIGDPGLFHIAERWADEPAISAHNKTAHLAAFMGALPAMGPTAVRLARYDGVEEKILVER
jgi:quinol monooxygenase YgiN